MTTRSCASRCIGLVLSLGALGCGADAGANDYVSSDWDLRTHVAQEAGLSICAWGEAALADIRESWRVQRPAMPAYTPDRTKG